MVFRFILSTFAAANNKVYAVMKRLFTVFLRDIIDENIKAKSKKVTIERDSDNPDVYGKSSVIHRYKDVPVVCTAQKVTQAVIDMMIGSDPCYMIVDEMRKMMTDSYSMSGYMHNVRFSKTEMAGRIGVSRQTLHSYLEKLQEKKAVILEDDGSVSLSFYLSPFNTTEAVRWHEEKMIDYASMGMIHSIAERRKWLYNRFLTLGYHIVMTEEGISFTWDDFDMVSYFLHCSMEMFGAGKDTEFKINKVMMIDEAAEHGVDVTDKMIGAAIRSLARGGYIVRIGGKRSTVGNQTYLFTDSVLFEYGSMENTDIR